MIPNLLLESGKDGVSTGLETDGQTPGTDSCGLQSDVSEVVHSRSRGWELMEQAFDDGNIHVQMRNLLVLFLIGSKFYLIFAVYINSSLILLPLLCMPLGIRLFVCRSVSEVEKAQLLNPLMNSEHSLWICIWAISSVCEVYFVGRVD